MEGWNENGRTQLPVCLIDDMLFIMLRQASSVGTGNHRAVKEVGGGW